MGVSFVNFVKLKKIGKGGQGTVFRGTNSDGLQFALKKVDDRADAQREVEALKRVGEHPNVVRVHGTEIVDDTAYVLMDLLQGESLGDYRGSFRWTTNTWWTTVLLPLLRGVSHIHAAGLVHRDLKPDNIIMVPDHQGSRRPVVVDLGLAKRTHSSRTHLIGKTPKYFSPEWSDIQLIKPAYDIFLLALITYEVLHGDEYYDADDDQWELETACERSLRRMVPPSRRQSRTRSMMILITGHRLALIGLPPCLSSSPTSIRCNLSRNSQVPFTVVATLTARRRKRVARLDRCKQCPDL